MNVNLAPGLSNPLNLENSAGSCIFVDNILDIFKMPLLSFFENILSKFFLYGLFFLEVLIESTKDNISL